MKSGIHTQSRRKTPWDHLSDTEIAPMQAYLRDIYHGTYDAHHKSLEEMQDLKLFDSYVPDTCPYCEADAFVRNGHYSNGFQRYVCKKCGKSFCITTGTIFEDHKISIGEWLQYLLNLFDFVSLTSDSKNNRNSYTTSRYWLQKVFLVLEGSQSSTVLKGNVYLDETFYSVRKADAVRKNGKLLRGISRNKMCIGTAADKTNIYCLYEGNGKPDSERTLLTFKDHIKEKSHLIHDDENSHTELVKELKLTEIVYSSDELKGLEDTENPLDRINNIHSLLKIFLDSHSGFLRKDLQGYLDLFVFIMNPPFNKLKKTERFLEMAVKKRAHLKYREFYKKKSDVESEPEEV